MWNAAAAAVAARSGHCQELDTFMPMPLAMPSPSSPLPLALQARKHAQAAMRLNSFGRRYLQYSQQHHQQQHSHYRRGCPLCGKFRYAAEDEALTASGESVLEQCDANENVASAQQQPLQPTIENPNQIDADAANGNVVDSATETAAAAATVADTDIDIDENDNSAAMSTAAASTATSATATTTAEAAADLDINHINENGIISLDMSKIIDISGLPTYEGALKLESSGYV